MSMIPSKDVCIEFLQDAIKLASFNQESLNKTQTQFVSITLSSGIFKVDFSLPYDRLIYFQQKIVSKFSVNLYWNLDRLEVTLNGIKNDFNVCKGELVSFLDSYKTHIVDHTFNKEYLVEFFYKTTDPVSNIQISYNKGLNLIHIQGTLDEVMKIKGKLDTFEEETHVETWNLFEEFSTNELMVISQRNNYLNLKGIENWYFEKYKSLAIFKFPILFRFNIDRPIKSRRPLRLKRRRRISFETSTAKQSNKIIVQLSGSCQLVIKPFGNIAEELSDVIVSVLGTEKDLRKTKTGRAINRRFPLHWKELKQKGDFQYNKSIITVMKPEGMHCKAICHLVLKAWNKAMSPYMLRQAIGQVFTQGRRMGAKSISFPPLGCGIRFEYPPSTVARIMFEAIQDETKCCSFQEIIILANNVIFHNALNQQAISLSQEIVKKSNKSESFGAVAIDTSELTILTYNKSIVQQIKDQINIDLRQKCLSTSCFSQDLLQKWPERSWKKILDYGKESSVWVELSKDPNSKCISFKLTGDKHNVQLLHFFVQQEFAKETVHLPKRSLISYKAPKRGTPEFLTYAAESDEKFPSYWNSATSEGSLPDHVSLIPVNDAIKKAISDLIKSTFRQDVIGFGKDARNLYYKHIKVIDVKRVENMELFSKYREQRRHLFKKKSIEGQLCPDIGSLPKSRGKVKTTELLSDVMKKELYHEINEHYLFHGTKAKFVDVITKRGFDPKVANSGAMLGKGVYAAEEFSKSDQYSDDKRNRQGSGVPLKMFLVRMLLGSPFPCHDDPRRTRTTYSRPPCRRCNKDFCVCPDQELYDSLMADGQWLFREFVVYEPNLCYPEYIITYTRTSENDDERAGSGEEM